MSTKNTMYDTQPVTKSTAQANNMYLCVTNQTPGQLVQFLKQYTKPQLYVTTCSGIDILLDTQYAYLNFPYTSYTVFDPSTGKQMHNLCTVEQVINMMLRPPMQLKEISNDKVSVFLDEINLSYYKNLADEILRTFGNNRLPDQTMTGQQFFDRINELIQVANDIMDKKLVPDLFQCIPLKKNGTFQADRKIILYQNNCNYVHQMDAPEYPSALKLVLCIVPHDTLEYEQVYDLVEPVHEKRARVAIVFMDAPRKLFALLDSHKQVQDIVTKATYLKDNQVLAGNIYRTKSGTEFLYVGCCTIDEMYDSSLQNYLTRPTQQPWRGYYTYLRVTQKVQTLMAQHSTFEDFFKAYIQQALTDASATTDLKLSCRIKPQKFTEEVARPFPQPAWQNVNTYKQNTIPQPIQGTVFAKYTLYDSHYQTDKSIIFIVNIFTD